MRMEQEINTAINKSRNVPFQRGDCLQFIACTWSYIKHTSFTVKKKKYSVEYTGYNVCYLTTWGIEESFLTELHLLKLNGTNRVFENVGSSSSHACY